MPMLGNLEIKTVFLYEMIGMAVLTTAFNLGGVDALARALFFVTFIAWEVSYANFNAAVTIGQFFANVDLKKRNFGEVIKPTIAILIAQMIGAFLGTFFTYLMTVYYYNIDTSEGSEAIGTLPTIQTLCPQFQETYYNSTIQGT